MGRLLSVNVGLPRDIAWQGKTVHTGIWKTPVEGPRMARRLNIDGDGQGDLNGHGGERRAVFVYQMDSYRYWQNHLGRNDFVYGQFGENFTVDGLPDAEVCIGDRYRIGGALFEVTQPRVTCYRLGIRMNEPEMAALVVKHGRPGFYFRVLEEGRSTGGRRDHSGRLRTRAHDRVRNRCPALQAGSPPRPAGARAAHPDAERRVASIPRGIAHTSSVTAVRRRETPGSMQLLDHRRRGMDSVHSVSRARYVRAEM